MNAARYAKLLTLIVVASSGIAASGIMQASVNTVTDVVSDARTDPATATATPMYSTTPGATVPETPTPTPTATPPATDTPAEYPGVPTPYPDAVRNGVTLYHPDDPGTQMLDGFNSTRIARLVHEEVNDERQNLSHEELDEPRQAWEWKSSVASVARTYAETIGERDNLTHYLDGTTPQQRYWTVGDDCDAMGENLGYTYGDVTVEGGETFETDEELARHMVEMWLNSPGHRRLLLTEDERYDFVGVGVHMFPDDDGVKVWVALNTCEMEYYGERDGEFPN